MKCEECRLVLEEYLDRELSPHNASEVLSHVGHCAVCREALEQLELEQRVYASYERDIKVSPLMWSKVSAQLDNEAAPAHVQGWQQWLAQLFVPARINIPVTAVLVLIAVALTAGVMRMLERSRDDVPANVALTREPVKYDEKVVDDAKPATTEPAVREAPPVKQGNRRREVLASSSRTVRRVSLGSESAADLARDAEKKYLSAIALLTRDVNRRPTLDDESRAKFDGALAAIDRTILATRQAVRSNPHDPVAVEYLLSAYRKKVDVLREMTSY